ncbi:MAG TPA: hypothetical protein PKH51_07550, partial [Candidatus Sumerlaeota bacterium]|nr:hypothetical protein [Candidatus Sumerlaeota bacterium]
MAASAILVPVSAFAEGAAADAVTVPITSAQPGDVWPSIVGAIVMGLLNCLFTMGQTAIAALGPHA